MGNDVLAEDVFTDHEIDMLIFATVLGGGEGVPQYDSSTVLEWAKQAQINSGIVSGILSGQFVPRIKDGEVEWRCSTKAEQAKFSATAQLALRKRAALAAD